MQVSGDNLRENNKGITNRRGHIFQIAGKIRVKRECGVDPRGKREGGGDLQAQRGSRRSRWGQT